MTIPTTTRRDFLATAAVATAGLSIAGNAYAAGSDAIRVGVIGCGGRGSGAADNVLNSAPNVKIVAIGDVFKFRVDGLRGKLAKFAAGDTAKKMGNGIELTDDRCFHGLDAFEKVINSDANYIILATPPGFRPLHLQAAVAAGKNIFTEKPVGVDGPGIRKVLAAYDDAMKKGLFIAAGTQRRHQLGYVETMKRIHDGAIGDIVAARAYWNGQSIWFHKREELAKNKLPDCDLAYQLHNWYHFVWTCGDHIVEQHVHNLDVVNWAMKAHPVSCDAAGGRTAGNPSRPEGDPNVVGQIFDNFSVDYVYPNGAHMYSSCRHIPGCKSNVSEALVGTKGVCDVNGYSIGGKRVMTRDQDRAAADPYVQEHTDLIAAIRGGKPLNELKDVAESTLTAIMGRISAYTGKPVTWEQALNSKLDTFPTKLDWTVSLPVTPTPTPGKTPLV